jgi:hypothetical protein
LAVAGGFGGGVGALAVGAAVRGGVVAVGSGAMMLTAGVEAADGNSALVGLPVAIVVGATTATGPTAGTFQVGEYRAIMAS